MNRWKYTFGHPVYILAPMNLKLDCITVAAAEVVKMAKNATKFIFSFDPLGQPKATACRDHCFRTCCLSVRPSPHFKSRETKQQKTMLATGVTMGLAEWIIDDSCLSLFCSPGWPSLAKRKGVY